MAPLAQNTAKDYLWLQLKELPYFRAVLRAVECRFYQDYPLESPTLDLGCGDGHFATVAFDRRLEVGIDPWTAPVLEAGQRGGYCLTVQGYGDRLPFPDGYFSSAVSNSVLEHIPDLDATVNEIGRVMKPGALFLFCVPNHLFLSNLSVSNGLDRVGLRGLADAYRGFFNRISRHHHCDSPEIWQARLEHAGFEIEKWWHYFSPRALHILEWGHYFGLPSWIAHAIFKKWILSAAPWNLVLTRKLVEPAYTEPREQPQGSYTFFVARKKIQSS
jgi:SAM-dependent methyltransferase